jgi:hypothetical protein
MIEGRTDGSPASGAEIELRSPSGVVLATGTLNDAGQFQWPLTHAGDIDVMVNAGLGHRRTLTLTAAELRAPAPPSSRTTANPGDVLDPLKPSAPQARGSSESTWSVGLRVFVGLTFLLALAAAWMSYRNTQRLAELERRGRTDAS